MDDEVMYVIVIVAFIIIYWILVIVIALIYTLYVWKQRQRLRKLQGDEVTDDIYQEVMTTDNLTSANCDGDHVSNINYISTTSIQASEKDIQCLNNAASRNFVEIFFPSSCEGLDQLPITDLEATDEPESHDPVDKFNSKLQVDVIVSNVLEDATAQPLNKTTAMQHSGSIKQLTESDTVIKKGTLADEETVGIFHGVCNGTLDNASVGERFKNFKCSLPNDSNSGPSCHVAIHISYDNSALTLAEEYDDVIQHNTTSAAETIKLQDNPAYIPLSDHCSTASYDDTIVLQDNPKFTPLNNHCSTTSYDDTIVLQDNPKFIPLSNQCSTASYDDTIEPQDNPKFTPLNDQCSTTSYDDTIVLQDNPKFIPLSKQCSTTSDDETIELQDNPAYIPLSDHSSTTSNGETIELQDNPAYIPLSDWYTTASSDDAVQLQRNPAYIAISLSNL